MIEKAVLPPPGELLDTVDGKYSPSWYSKHFPEWYPKQDEAVEFVLDWLESDKRFAGLSIPTGGGKSLISQVVSYLSNRRSFFLTATKGLQAQIWRDFSRLGMVDVRGQNNYQCIADVGSVGRITPDGVGRLTADEGPCHEGYNCPYKMMGCPYYERLREALRAKRVITNYYYYLAQTHYADGLGDIGLLTLDEGHLAGQALEHHLSTNFGKDELEALGGYFPSGGFPNWNKWKDWAKTQADIVGEEVVRLKEQIQELREEEGEVPAELSRAYRRASGLEKRLLHVADSGGEWVQEKWQSTWKVTPVWVADYSALLFGNVPKIIIMSAVLTRKTLEVLGVPEEQTDFLEMPSYFPKENNPIYHVPTVRMNWRTDESELGTWVSRIDQIISKRLDRKIIVFTVSYKRRNFLMEKSKYADIMISHGTKDVVEQVNKFKRAKAPMVLVSPAVTSGWDFFGDECRTIIVGKLPYPDTQDPVMKARQEIDDDWTSWIAMDTLIQELGRGFRSPDDFCECIILDDSWYWYWRRYQHMAPMWFRDRVLGTVDTIPEPLEIRGSA